MMLRWKCPQPAGEGSSLPPEPRLRGDLGVSREPKANGGGHRWLLTGIAPEIEVANLRIRDE